VAGAGYATNNLAILRAQQGDYALSIAEMQALLASLPGREAPYVAWAARTNLATALASVGRLEEAEQTLDALEADSGFGGEKILALRTRGLRGLLAHAAGRLDEAVATYEEAVATAMALEDFAVATQCTTLLAAIDMERGDALRGLRRIEDATRRAPSLGPDEAAFALAVQALAQAATGQEALAQASLDAAVALLPAATPRARAVLARLGVRAPELAIGNEPVALARAVSRALEAVRHHARP
jgi:tetratricopeptide (TPR) repeat protein